MDRTARNYLHNSRPAGQPPRTPAPDAVAALESVGQTLASLELYANMSDQERADINDDMHRKSAGNVGYGDMVADACESLRAAHATLRAALADSLTAIKILREELRKRGGDADPQIEAAISSHDLRALFSTLKGEH